MNGCTYKGLKGQKPPTWSNGRVWCFRKATVRIRQITGNPFVERDVCRTHADEMIESGHFTEVKLV
jgi:hypothetical protein